MYKPNPDVVDAAKDVIKTACGPNDYEGLITLYTEKLSNLDAETLECMSKIKELEKTVQTNNQNYVNSYEILCWMQSEVEGTPEKKVLGMERF
jgi:hypothetical protein